MVHLGNYCAKRLQQCLTIANKVPSQEAATYFQTTPSTNMLNVWDSTGSHVNSTSMAVMHMLANRIIRANPSKYDYAGISNTLSDDIGLGYQGREWTPADGDRRRLSFFSIGLLSWAAKDPAGIEANIMG